MLRAIARRTIVRDEARFVESTLRATATTVSVGLVLIQNAVVTGRGGEH